MAKSNTTTEYQPITGTVGSRNLTAQFHASMLQRARDNGVVDRTDDIMSQQAERILTATSVEDILKADLGGTVQCRDVPNTYWQIRSIDPVTSTRTFEDGGENQHGYYLQADATCIGGDQEVLTRNGLVVGTVYPLQTGAVLLMLKLKALEAADAFPINLALIGIKTQSGNTVLKWGPMPVSVSNGNRETTIS
jgi:hypothetical protein